MEYGYYPVYMKETNWVYGLLMETNWFTVFLMETNWFYGIYNEN